MPLTSIYNAVKNKPTRLKSIQEIMQENPEKRNMFADSDIVLGKNASVAVSVKSNSTSVRSIAQNLEPSQGAGNPLPLVQKTWQKCKCLKEKQGAFFCQKFLIKCVQDKCPQKFIEM